METKTIIAGIKWTSVQFALDAGVRFLIKLVLAKLLFPTQFGLIGLASIFIAVANAASELGISAALIQKKEDREAEKLYSTAFWTGIVWGIALFLVMAFLVGPFAAHFYNEPLLISLIPALSLGILVRPLNSIHVTILTRAMDFKQLAKIYNSATFIAGACAVLAAYLGAGVWALVINTTLATLISVPFLFLSTKWQASWEWNKKAFRSIFGFGAFSTGTKIFSTLTYNIDNLMIGKLLGTSLLGSYTLAFSMTEQLRQMISSILNKVMYPVFGQKQDSKSELRRYFLKIIKINALTMYPLMAFLVIFANEIILGFFGEKWIDTIIPLQLLAVSMMIHLIVNSFASLIRGLGKPALEMKIIIGLNVLILMPGLYFGISFFGLIGAALAIVVNKVVLVFIALIVLNKEIDLKYQDVFSVIYKPFISIIIGSLMVSVLRNLFMIDEFFTNATVFILSYLTLIYFLEKEELGRIKSQLLK